MRTRVRADDRGRGSTRRWSSNIETPKSFYTSSISGVVVINRNPNPASLTAHPFAPTRFADRTPRVLVPALPTPKRVSKTALRRAAVLRASFVAVATRSADKPPSFFGAAARLTKKSARHGDHAPVLHGRPEQRTERRDRVPVPFFVHERGAPLQQDGFAQRADFRAEREWRLPPCSGGGKKSHLRGSKGETRVPP